MKKDYIVELREEEADELMDDHWVGELVRCKDCKWFYQPFKSEGRCLNHDNDYHEPNWFCADGERRTDDA